jgi:hypothetical protein
VGNVRNPVGPLPSSIYWRRRAVVLCLFAIAVALVVWAVTRGGGSSDAADGASASHSPGTGHHRTPLPSITPGPTTSQTGITTEPGGRSTGGSDGSSGGSSGGTSAGSSGGTGDGGASSGGTGGGDGLRLPVGTSVPDCTASQVTLTIRSVQHSYRPGQEPQFALAAVNSGGGACKVNFSAVSAVVTVTDAAGHHTWATADCPADRDPYLLEVPAEATTTYDVTWNRVRTAPDCATPTASGPAAPGDYHAKVAIPNLGTAQATFTLTQS